jgi:hypothetical protein
VRNYKLKFSPDIVTGTAGYDIFFGFSGYTAFAFSDLLGDHKIFLNLNLVSDLKNSGISLTYLNLKRRINWGIGGYHQAWSFRNFGNDFQRYRNFGVNFLLSYPFSKFNRLDFNLNWYNVYLEYLTQPVPDEKVTTLLPSLSYVHDSALRGYTGPMDGSRYAISFLASPKYTEESIDFTVSSPAPNTLKKVLILNPSPLTTENILNSAGNIILRSALAAEPALGRTRSDISLEGLIIGSITSPARGA